MESVAPNHEELSNELLKRLSLLQAARGAPEPFWRIRLKMVYTLVGALFLYRCMEALPEAGLLVLGVAMLVIGLAPSRHDSDERLDALIEFLDRKGQLVVPDGRIDEERPI